MTTRQLSALLIIASLWGASFLYIRVLVDAGVEPAGVSALRTVIGASTLLPFAFAARHHFPRDRRTWTFILALGLANFAAPWTVAAFAQQRIPSSVASVVNSAMPLWTAIFAVVLTRSEPLRGAQEIGLFLGFLGVVALLGGDIGDLRGDSATGIALMLLATAMYGCSAVVIRRWLGHVSPVALTIGQVGFASLFLGPLALATGAYSTAEIGPPEVASGLALGGISSGVAVMVFMWLIREVGPVRASVVTYLMPPIGVFLGWAVLSEPVGWNLVVGLVLIASGVALVQGLPLLRPLLMKVGAPPRVEPAKD